jgi:hypothetical protein
MRGLSKRSVVRRTYRTAAGGAFASATLRRLPPPSVLPRLAASQTAKRAARMVPVAKTYQSVSATARFLDKVYASLG